MRRLPPLSALLAFEAAARHGSFKRAAQELAVTPTAISHQIRSLEEQTGLTLFERQVRKVVLTEAGARLYPVLREGFDSFEAAFAEVLRSKQRERVSISATNAFTAKWLVPRVAGFHRLHPEIDLQLHASDVVIDLAEQKIDIAIRYGRGPYPGMTVEPMFSDQFAPVVSPALGVRTPADLQKVPRIHFEWKRAHPANPTWDVWFEQAHLPRTSTLGQLRFSDESHAIHAAVAGQGIALVSLVLVETELASGQLVQPFGPTLTGYAHHLVTPGETAPSPSVLAAVRWLQSEVAVFKRTRKAKRGASDT
ncbi:MAG: transcriptional regulator GcvA [Cystobacter sp.]